MAGHSRLLSILIFLLSFLSGNLSEAISTELEQTINEFHLSGFSDKGQRTWEIFSKSADIFSDQIKLNDVEGKIYGQEEIVVTAEKGDFDRTRNSVRLEKNVVITTESGAVLTTDYLNWDKETSLVTTDAPVDIKKDNIVTTGVGIRGDVDLRTVDLKRDVKVEIDNQKKKIVITCSGPLSINYADNVAVFKKDVFVDDGESQMYADLMDVYFEAESSANLGDSPSGRIRKIVARDNVKIVRGENISFADEATYSVDNKTITLTGRPKLIIYSTEEKDASVGN
ncbi:MAG: LPS export ABC transporter periplasmic protein LptC [Candidatus Omnitrophota bacterium]